MKYGKEVADEISRLQTDGLVTPQRIVDAAQSEDSPLHSHFTWDDTEAARSWRVEQARAMIMKVRVNIETRPNEPPIQVRAFVSLASDRVSGGGYRSVQAVLEDPTRRAEMLSTALEELQTLQKRYGHLSELATVFAALDFVAA